MTDQSHSQTQTSNPCICAAKSKVWGDARTGRPDSFAEFSASQANSFRRHPSLSYRPGIVSHFAAVD
jgi:hypothetical protein